jgi:hypothetical protein
VLELRAVLAGGGSQQEPAGCYALLVILMGVSPYVYVCRQ